MYRLLDHTADLAIEARGEDLGEALAEAARGLYEVVTGRRAEHNAQAPIAFTLEAPDEGALVVVALSELLWIREAQGLLWSGGGMRVEPGGAGWRVIAEGNGVLYEPEQHGHGVEVKAVTYHDLRIERKKDVAVHVVLDL